MLAILTVACAGMGSVWTHALGPPLLVTQTEVVATEAADPEEEPVEGEAAAASPALAAEPVADPDPADRPVAAPVAESAMGESASAMEEVKATDVEAHGEMDSAIAESGPAAGAQTWVIQKTREQTTTGDKSRPWHASGSVEFRTLAISDEDPANDRYLSLQLRGDFDVFEGARAFVRFSGTQQFTAEVGESGFLLQDTMVGLDYGHEVALDFVPIEALAGKKLELEHRLALYFPTSRQSINQDKYFAPMLMSRARYSVLESLVVGVDAFARYHFHRYAERAGPSGGLNTQLDMFGSLGVEYTVFSHKEYGTVSVGADLATWYLKSYPSGEEYESESSSETYWHQRYDWDIYATYTPLPYMTVVLGIETMGEHRRDGIIASGSGSGNGIPRFFGQRDDTELFLQVLGRY